MSFDQKTPSVQFTLHQYLVLYSLIGAVFVVEITPFPPTNVPLSNVCQLPLALLLICQETESPLASKTCACNKGVSSTPTAPFDGTSFEITGGTSPLCVSSTPTLQNKEGLTTLL